MSKTSPRVGAAFVAAVPVAYCLPAVAPEEDERWEITVKMEMTGTMKGQPMGMSQAYSGKRVGSCTAPAKGK